MTVNDHDVERIEAMIRSQPANDLPTTARERIIARIKATESQRDDVWWRVPVPLWAAAAAVIVVAAASVVAARSFSPRGLAAEHIVAQDNAPQRHTIEHALIARSDRNHRPDITRWQVVSTSNRSPAP